MSVLEPGPWQGPPEAYVLWMPLRRGMSFEAAARRSHQVVLAADRAVGGCVVAADVQLAVASNPGARWRLYGNSITSVSEALRRIETSRVDLKESDRG